MVKNSPASAGDAGDVGSLSGSGRSPGGGNSNPWTEAPGWLQSIGSQESDMTEQLGMHAGEKDTRTVLSVTAECDEDEQGAAGAQRP